MTNQRVPFGFWQIEKRAEDIRQLLSEERAPRQKMEEEKGKIPRLEADRDEDRDETDEEEDYSQDPRWLDLLKRMEEKEKAVQIIKDSQVIKNITISPFAFPIFWFTHYSRSKTLKRIFS